MSGGRRDGGGTSDVPVGPPPAARASGRQRLDQLLVQRGLCATRAQAAAVVLAGQVRIGAAVASKPGQAVAVDAPLEVRAPRPPYASRGGFKLAGALDAFGLDPAGYVCIDVGASTGGFTDCLLQRGAARVYAVDVGRGQLAWALRGDPRVVVLERENARHLDPEHVPEPADALVADVSFISLAKVLPAALARLAPPAADRPWAVVLIKPQFEAGPRHVGRGGIVRDPKVHLEVLCAVGADLGRLGWPVVDLRPAWPRGADGNREFVALLRPGTVDGDGLEALAAAAVAEAWRGPERGEGTD